MHIVSESEPRAKTSNGEGVCRGSGRGPLCGSRARQDWQLCEGTNYIPQVLAYCGRCSFIGTKP